MKTDVLRYLAYEGQEIDEALEGDIDTLIEKTMTFPGKFIYECVSREWFEDYFNHPEWGDVLESSNQIVVFAGSLGYDFDRFIKQVSYQSQTKAYLLNACGSAYLEKGLDDLMASFQAPFISLRYSPGYGHIPLELQEKILRMLDAQKKIGISINQAYVMSPSKSVTGFFGLSEEALRESYDMCSACKYRTTCNQKICRRSQ